MPSTSFSRRRLLAAAGLIGTTALSGCTDSLPGTGSEPKPELQLFLEEIEGSLRDRYVTDLDESRPDWDEHAFRAAVAGETFTTQHRPPFPTRGGDDDPPAYAKHDGTYYRLDSVVVGEKQVTNPILRLHNVGRVSELDPVPEHTASDDLPQIDVRAVKIAYFAARARGNVGGVPWGLVQRGGYVYRDEQAARRSTLLADGSPTHVEYRDRIWKIEIVRETFHERIYRADVDPVASSPSEMETVLRAVLLDARIDPATLSSDEREIVQDAQQHSGYTATFPFPDALSSLLKRLHQRAYLDGNVRKDGRAEGSTVGHLLLGDRYFEYRIALQSPSRNA